MPPNNRLRHAFTPVDVPNQVLNNNNGSGTFNQVNGVQNNYHCSHYHSYPSTCNPKSGVAEEGGNSEGPHHGATTDKCLTQGRELEPYRTAIELLRRIRWNLRSYSERFPAVLGIRNEADELAALLRCVAMATCQIRQPPSVLTSHSFFSLIEHNAFEWTRGLKRLENDLYELDSHQDLSRTAEMVEATACLWTSLFQRLRESFRACRARTTQFLRIIVA